MTILRRFSFALTVVAVLVIPNRAAQAQAVPVTSCGAEVDNGYLTGDLDCRGMEDQIPVMVRHHGSLDLGGFTLYVGKLGVWCGNFVPSPGGGGFSGNFGKCTISNGVIRDGLNSAIAGKKITVKNVSILDFGDRAIDGFGGAPHSDRVEVIDSTISGSKVGVSATGVILKNSTVTGNEIGIFAKNAKLRDSSVTENGTNPACTTDCMDLQTTRRPRLKNSTCNHSRGNNNGDWAVCTYDDIR